MGNMLKRGIEAYQSTIRGGPENSPEEQPGLVKTTRSKEAVSPKTIKTKYSPEEKQKPDSKYRRVAKFLILIGGDQAAEILAQLDPHQVEEISREIALIKVIKPEEGKEILAEFHSLFSMPYSHSGLSQGGIESARRILYAAMGPEKGETLLNRAVPESKGNIFGFLNEFTPEQLVMLLKAETPQTAALILSRLPPKLSAGTVSKLPSDRKPEILLRIAHQGDISPDVLEQVAAALKDKVRNISGGARDFEIDGMQTLAAIIKQGDYAFGDWIINELEESDPDIGRTLKEKLYTLDDIILAVDRPLQGKLKTMSDRDIAILLKGRGKKFSEKILSCVSMGRREIILEEYEFLGAVPKRECDAAAREFLSWFRFARENGYIILSTDEDVYI